MSGPEEVVYEEQEDEGKTCAICDLGLAAVGIVIGCIFLYIGVDILTKSALSRAISRGSGELV